MILLSDGIHFIYSFKIFSYRWVELFSKTPCDFNLFLLIEKRKKGKTKEEMKFACFIKELYANL